MKIDSAWADRICPLRHLINSKDIESEGGPPACASSPPSRVVGQPTGLNRQSAAAPTGPLRPPRAAPPSSRVSKRCRYPPASPIHRTRCGADRAGLALRAALGLRGSELSNHLRSSDDSFGMRGRRVRFGEGVEEEVVNSGIRSVLSQRICCVALTFAPSKSFRVSNLSLCAVTTVGFDGGQRR